MLRAVRTSRSLSAPEWAHMMPLGSCVHPDRTERPLLRLSNTPRTEPGPVTRLAWTERASTMSEISSVSCPIVVAPFSMYAAVRSRQWPPTAWPHREVCRCEVALRSSGTNCLPIDQDCRACSGAFDAQDTRRLGGVSMLFGRRAVSPLPCRFPNSRCRQQKRAEPRIALRETLLDCPDGLQRSGSTRARRFERRPV